MPPPLAAAIWQVYPRVCGGTCRRRKASPCSTGLSPRVRGNPWMRGGRRVGSGSIPACAGEPGLSGRCGRQATVYPRVCGGTSGGLELGGEWSGLSPRVRGNPSQNRRKQSGPGSIPACAGEPKRQRGAGFQRRVYPRVCGGTQCARRAASGGQGLSPRVRGNPARPRRWPPYAGSIPACAGEPYPAGRRRYGTGVYPRVCGGTTA